MSTSAQVNNNFNAYIGTYISQQTSTSYDAVIQNIQNGTYVWTLGFDGTNLFVSTWSVSGVTSPAFSDLQSISPSAVVGYLQKNVVYQYYFTYPNGFQVLLDIYNKIITLQGGTTFANVQALIDYLSTLMQVTV